MHKISTALTALVLAAISFPVSLFAQNNNQVGATGNIGIGTTTPPNRLTIESTDPIVANYIRMEHKGIPNSLLLFGTAPSNYQVTLHQNANVLESYTDLHLSAANTGRIFFETGRTGTAAPVRMTLTNTGLGIGTTTPTTSFNVNGGAIRLKNPGLYPYGMNIDVDFTGTWAREYSFSYNGAGKMFAWGVYGSTNSLIYAYIGGNSTTAEVVATLPWMVFRPNGNIGIGTTEPGSYKLAVEGTIGARRVKVTQGTWADFVFQPDYKLPALSEVEQYINANQHLPEIPSAAEVEKEGLDLGEMNKKLLQKVEELTLYLIEQQKTIKALQEKDALREARLQALENK
jgi:hypothetical protein